MAENKWDIEAIEVKDNIDWGSSAARKEYWRKRWER